MVDTYTVGTVPEIALRHRLRIAREHRELEQTQLAELIGVGQNTVSNAERGKTTPSKSVLMAWAMATGVPAVWLLEGVDPKARENAPSEKHAAVGNYGTLD